MSDDLETTPRTTKAAAAEAGTGCGNPWPSTATTVATEKVMCGTTETALEKAVKDINFEIEKSMRYHQRRRAHYDLLHRLLMFISILAGSAAFASFEDNPQAFGLIGAVSAALNLVWGFSHRARDHEILFRRFSALAIDLRTQAKPTDAQLLDWQRQRIQIEADELPVFWAVEADCYNEVVRALGKQGQGLAKIPYWCGLLQNWLRFETLDFPIVSPPSPTS